MDITVEMNTETFLIQSTTEINQFEVIVTPEVIIYNIEVAQLGEKGEKGDKGDIGSIDGGIIF